MKTTGGERKPVLYFDVSEYVHATRFTGIQRVVYEFLKYFPELAVNYEFITVAFSEPYGYVRTQYKKNRWLNLSLINPAKGDVFLAIDLTADAVVSNKKNFIEWKKRGCKLIFCVHDICFIKHPRYVNGFRTPVILTDWLNVVCEVGDGIITVSKTIMEEVKNWVDGRDCVNTDLKFGFFHHGSDLAVNDIRKTHDGFNFIAVSTIEPRKGYSDLIWAYEHSVCSGENSKLIIVGRRGWQCLDIIKNIENSPLYGKKIFWYSDASDDVLKYLYSISNMYITASYYEGFGIGLVEASSFKLPLLVRDIQVNREIVGENGLYFNDRESLSNQMDASFNGKIVDNNLKYLTWKQSVEMAINAIKGMGFLL